MLGDTARVGVRGLRWDRVGFVCVEAEGLASLQAGVRVRALLRVWIAGVNVCFGTANNYHFALCGSGSGVFGLGLGLG